MVPDMDSGRSTDSSLGRVCREKRPDIDLEYLHAFEKATARGGVAMPPGSEWREVENI